MKRIIIVITGLLFCASTSANMIFPAFSAPYVSTLIFPVALVAVLIIESAIFKKVSANLTILKVILLVIIVNLVSWFGGVLFTGFLPSGLITNEEGMVTSGPDFSFYASLGFLVAYVLSFLIEAGVLKLISYKINMASPIKMSFYANTASYFALTVIVWVMK